MTTAPLAIEKRQRGRAYRVAIVHRLAVPIGLLIVSTAVMLAIGFSADGSGFLKHLVGMGGKPLSRLAGFAFTTYVGAWAVFLMIRGLRYVLRPVHPIFAVARLTIDEALRSNVVVLFTAALLALICGLPLALNALQPLRYQIQSYITYSHILAAFLLGLMTLLFASWNVARDMEQQRAFDVFSKPITRIGYLLGKFAGVALLNLILVIVVTGVLWYIPRVLYGSEASIAVRTIKDGRVDAYDRLAVNSEVLTARGSVKASPPFNFLEEASKQLQAYSKNDAQGYADFVRASGGEGAALLQASNQIANDWLQVEPLSNRQYIFRGLDRAKRLADAAIANDTPMPMLQLRYHVEIPAMERSTPVKLTIAVDNVPSQITALVDQKQVYAIPASYVNDDGTLAVTMLNAVPLSDGRMSVGTGDRPRTIKFAKDDGLEVLYEVGSFGPNVMRGGLVLWLRLTFLAALGTVCGAVFSFAVAAVTALFIALMAAGGESIASVVASGGADTGIGAVDAAYGGLLGFAGMIASVLRTFSRLDTGAALADGRAILMSDVYQTVLWITLGWTGIALLVGWLLFSRREIARVQV